MKLLMILVSCYVLVFSVVSADTWHIETVDSVGDVGAFTSLTLDSNYYSHISYTGDDDNCLKYAYWDGSSWNITYVDSGSMVGWHTSIAIDANDNPCISYYANGDLRYAYYEPEGIEEEEGGLPPDGFILYNANPNPCAGNTNISFTIPVSSNINLDLYDITGRKVAVLAEGAFSKGIHEVEISGLANGIYLCALQVGNFVDTKTITVIK